MTERPAGGWWPIRTGQNRVPWGWVALLSLPWASMVYFDLISNVAMTFKLREFVAVPLLLTLVGSFNQIFNIAVGATCNYASDRIWTPWGRRKPFLLLGWAVVMVGCLLVPAINDFALIVALLFFYEMLRDLATPYESLCNEVVPPAQRGRANAAYTFARQGIMAVFFAVMVGQWDRVYHLPGGWVLTGEQVLFGSGAVVALLTIWLVSRVREVPPAVLPARPARPTWAQLRGQVRAFGREVFGQRQWLWLYGVALAQMVFWTDFGSLAPLLYTEQWGFSKQAYGNVLALASGVTLVLFLPLGGWLADRGDRLRLFRWMAAAMMLNHAAFFLYLKLLAGGAPSLVEVTVFKLIGTGVGTVGTVVSVALMFDFVPRNRLGTVLAGIGLTRGLGALVVNNGIGFWVTAAAWLTPRAAEATAPRVYDYTLGYAYLALCGAAAWWFARRFGRVAESGTLVRHGMEDLPPERA